jgi:hypothetical protein
MSRCPCGGRTARSTSPTGSSVQRSASGRMVRTGYCPVNANRCQQRRLPCAQRPQRAQATSAVPPPPGCATQPPHARLRGRAACMRIPHEWGAPPVCDCGGGPAFRKPLRRPEIHGTAAARMDRRKRILTTQPVAAIAPARLKSFAKCAAVGQLRVGQLRAGQLRAVVLRRPLARVKLLGMRAAGGYTGRRRRTRCRRGG